MLTSPLGLQKKTLLKHYNLNDVRMIAHTHRLISLQRPVDTRPVQAQRQLGCEKKRTMYKLTPKIKTHLRIRIKYI